MPHFTGGEGGLVYTCMQVNEGRGLGLGGRRVCRCTQSVRVRAP